LGTTALPRAFEGPRPWAELTSAVGGAASTRVSTLLAFSGFRLVADLVLPRRAVEGRGYEYCADFREALRGINPIFTLEKKLLNIIEKPGIKRLSCPAKRQSETVHPLFTRIATTVTYSMQL
jgi:hypothetical protein